MNKDEIIAQMVTQYWAMDEDRVKEIASFAFDAGARSKEEELSKYKVFHDHVKAHFEAEHPDWEVMCKICNKTFSEITEALRK